MHDVNPFLPRAAAVLATALWLLGSAAAQADTPQSMRERQRIYQQERQVCLSGQSQQDQATCLREAGAALQQNIAGQRGPSAAALEANALQRCNAFTNADAHHSCLARMRQGRVDGSTASGGILRELREPAP